MIGFPPLFRIPQEGVNADWPDSVYFTFQLYRFPPVTTHRLKLLGTDKPENKSRGKLPCVLALVNKEGAVDSGKGHRDGVVALAVSIFALLCCERGSYLIIISLRRLVCRSHFFRRLKLFVST